MAALGAQTVAASYEQLLHVDTDGGGNGNNLLSIKDGDNGTTFGLKLATNKVKVIPGSNDANAFEVSLADGTALFTLNTSTPGGTIVSDEENILRLDGLQGNIDFRYGSDIEFDRAGQVYITANNGSGELNFRTGGQNIRMHIDSSGKVGIGTDAPVCGPLQINHASADADNGILIVNEATTVADDTFLGGIGFDSADGNVPSSVGEASAAIVARSAEAHGTGDKGGNLLFLTSGIDDDDDTTSPERMRITSAGYVGIGTSSPTSLLDVEASSGASLLYEDSGEGLLSLITSGSTAVVRFDARSNENHYLTNGGNFGLGTASPSRAGYNTNYSVLTIEGVADNYGGVIELVNPNSNTNYFGTLSFANLDGGSSITARAEIKGEHGGADDASALTFWTEATGGSVTERMRIASDGDIHWNGNTSSPAATSGANGGMTFLPNSVDRYMIFLGSSSDSNNIDLIRFFAPAGSGSDVGSISTSGNQTNFETSSDYRLKENEAPLANGLTKLNQLKPYNFNWKIKPDEVVDGFFAHEVQEIVPFAVSGEKDRMETLKYEEADDIPKGKEIGDEYEVVHAQKLDHSKLVPLLVKAVQELSAKVEALENA